MEAAEKYVKHSNNRTASEAALKSASWECVECSELSKQAQEMVRVLDDVLPYLDPGDPHPEHVLVAMRPHRTRMLKYLQDLFKQKRTAASHIMVIMVASERRNRSVIKYFTSHCNAVRVAHTD